MTEKSGGRLLRVLPRINYNESASDSELESSVDERSSINSGDDSDTSSTTLVGGEDIVDCIEGGILVSMAGSRLNQLVAELETIFFQLGEIEEIVEYDLDAMSLKDAIKQYDELKELRVNMVKCNQELKLLNTEDHAAEITHKVDKCCNSSKDNLKTIKMRIAVLEKNKAQCEIDRLNEAKIAEWQKNQSRKLAFERISKEVDNMFVKLNVSYNAPSTNLSRDEMLKRKEDKPILAAEFDRLRERVEKLICDTDTQFDGKEAMIENAVKMLGNLEISKHSYEKKVYDDLLINDLTEDKLKLAQLTKIDIGHFSGGLGEDFYTFKTKFLKAYRSHPKSLMVEWLKNNHLRGKAKDSIGSLDDMDNIWKRLQENFGNTEQMLLYHFAKINKMGLMNRQRSYTGKKQYLLSLIKY